MFALQIVLLHVRGFNNDVYCGGLERCDDGVIGFKQQRL